MDIPKNLQQLSYSISHSDTFDPSSTLDALFIGLKPYKLQNYSESISAVEFFISSLKLQISFNSNSIQISCFINSSREFAKATVILSSLMFAIEAA